MKKRIDLFSKKKQQQPIPTQAVTLRNYGILVICICIILTILTGSYYYYIQQELEDYKAQVATIENATQLNTEIQGNIVYFITKKDQLNEFLRDDINFEVYYSLLRSILDQSGSTTTLSQMTLGEERDTSFVIQVPSFNDGESLMSYIESEDFLMHFEDLTMNSFAVDSGNELELRFRGKFKDREETEDESESGPEAINQSEG